MNRQSRIEKNLHTRAKVLQAVRMFFEKNGFLEVDTPVRIPAPAPEEHIDPVPSSDWALQSSPELCMKRLLSAGYEKIFQICKCFRNRERGDRHLPEFTMLEWYCADIEYDEFMTQCEALICFTAEFSTGSRTIPYQDHRVDLSSPWKRISVPDAFNRWGGISLQKALSEDRFDEVMVTDIEPNLGFDKPVFLYDYPAQRASLSKLNPVDPTLAQRFELYICGIELCNAFMELTDPREQRKRFEIEQQKIKDKNSPIYPIPEPFLAALENMPEAGGNALGLDRLVMLLADAADIDEVVTFSPEEL
jgi:lysyl-tRNA synthetase class 2